MTTTRGRRGAAGRVMQLGSGSVPDARISRFTASTATEAPKGRLTTFALSRLSEREFQRIVRGVLESLGFVVWVVPNMKLTTAGLPDLLFWHPGRPGVLHAWELKTLTGTPTPKQRAALAHLATVPGVDARIVRPPDWPALRDHVLLASTGDGRMER